MKAPKDSKANTHVMDEQILGVNNIIIQTKNQMEVLDDNKPFKTDGNEINLNNAPQQNKLMLYINNDFDNKGNEYQNKSHLSNNNDIFLPQFIQNKIEQKEIAEPHQSYQNSKNKFEEIYKKYSSILDKEKPLRIIFFIGIAFVVIILAISLGLIFYAARIMCIAILAMCFISIIVFVLSIIVLKLNATLIKNVIDSKDDPERITQSRERIYLYICIYLFSLIGVFYMVVGICLVAFQTNIKMDIRAEGYDKEKWDESYHNKSFNDVLNVITIIINALGSLCIILSLYIAAFTSTIIYLIRSYRTRKVVVQFSCIIFSQTCFVFVYFGLNCVKFNKVTLVDNGMPTWFSGGLFGLGIIGIFTGVFGFLTILLERKTLLKIFCIINICLFIVFLIMNIGGTKLTAKFSGYLTANCVNLFKYIDEDYLVNELGCDSKYLFVNDNTENMQCPKYRIIYVWEVNEKMQNNKKPTSKEASEEEQPAEETEPTTSRKYGCINQKCCLSAYSYIKTQYDYGLVVSFVLMFLCIFHIVNAVYLTSNVEKIFDEGIKDKMIYILLSIISFGIFILMVTFIALIPSAPEHTKIAEYEIEKTPSEFTMISSDEIIPLNQTAFTKITNDLLSTSITKVADNNKYNVLHKNAGSKAINTFTFEISTSDGLLQFKQNSDIPNINQEYDETSNTSTITFSGEQSLINLYLKYVSIVPTIITKVLTVNTIITGLVEDNTRLRNLALTNLTGISSNNSIEIDYSSLNPSDTPIVLKKSYDYSILNKTMPVFLSGNILGHTDNVYIEVTSEYYNSPIIYGYSNSNGEFKIGPLYPLASIYPISYNLTFREVNNAHQIIDKDVYYQEPIRIGGLGFDSSFLNFTNITLPSSIINTEFRVSGQAIDSETNENLKGVYLKIYKGNKEFTQSELVSLSSSQNVGNIIISITTVNGLFEFSVSSSGQYTAVFIKTNYYIETKYFVVEDSTIVTKIPKIAMTPVNNVGKTSFVLSWFGKTKDLDLHLKFRVEDQTYCDVFFGNTRCLGSVYNQDIFLGKNKGVENISIKNYGKYIYMFFVHKFTDVSNGIAYGEQKIEGIDDEIHDYFYSSHLNSETGEDEYDPSDDTANLIESLSSIKIFAPVYWTPITIVNIPWNSFASGNANNYKYWAAFCINGKEGLKSLKTINKLFTDEPDISICEDLYDD